MADSDYQHGTDLTNWYPLICRYLRLFASPHHSAEDLAQDTFVKAYRAVARYGPPRNPEGWLIAIAKNVAIDAIRREARQTLVELPELADETAPPSQYVADGELQELLPEALEGLDSRDRALVRGFYYRSKGCHELAEELGISYANTKIRLYRARKKLRGMLEG